MENREKKKKKKNVRQKKSANCIYTFGRDFILFMKTTDNSLLFGNCVNVWIGLHVYIFKLYDLVETGEWERPNRCQEKC